MHYVYILQSAKDGNLYVGRTEDIKSRLVFHKKGLVPSTKDRHPLRFLYAEVCNNVKDATHREKYLKTSWGKRYIKNRLLNDI